MDIQNQSQHTQVVQNKTLQSAEQKVLKVEKLGEGGFQLAVLKAGDGHTFPKKGDRVTVHYTGKLKDGTVFDSSRERGEAFTFIIGKGKVITGWDQGIKEMSLGEHGVLHVPSYKGYGSDGAGEIPPNSDLDFDIELLAINAPKDPATVQKQKSGVTGVSVLGAFIICLAGLF